MIVAMDLGNSRCKWALLNAGKDFEVVAKGDWDNRSFDQAHWLAQLKTLKASIDNKQKIESLIISCVASDEINQKLQSWCSQVFACETFFAQSQAFYKRQKRLLAANANKLSNIYQKSETLGVDRWLAILALFETSAQGFMVFDIGTAMTLDVVNDKGAHLGGQIVPGQQLMQSSLLGNTGKIAWGAARSEAQEQASLLADNTLQAVEQGAMSAQAGYCHLMIERLQQQYKLEQVVFTGGGAPAVLDNLNLSASKGFSYRPDLVLEGLFYWYKSLEFDRSKPN